MPMSTTCKKPERVDPFEKQMVEWKSQDLLVQPGGQLDQPGAGRENIQIRNHQEKKDSSIKTSAKPNLKTNKHFYHRGENKNKKSKLYWKIKTSKWKKYIQDTLWLCSVHYLHNNIFVNTKYSFFT